jgi:hypothetical protein
VITKAATTLTLRRAEVLLVAVAVRVALLDHGAVLEVVFLSLAARLADVACGWRAGTTGALLLVTTLRTFSDEVLGLR